jgi:hypothetical protein
MKCVKFLPKLKEIRGRVEEEKRNYTLRDSPLPLQKQKYSSNP